MTTKISSYRQGDPRFGRKGHNIDTTVRVSYLSPEELEEYRSGKRGGMKVFTFEQYKDMKAQGKSNKEITKEMNISEGTLYARLKVWKEPFGNNSIKSQEAEIKLKTDSETNDIREEKTPENEPSKESNDDVRLLHETIAEKNGIIQELQKKLNELEMPVIDPNSITVECESLANLLIKKNHDYGNSVQEQFDEYKDIAGYGVLGSILLNKKV